MKLVGPVRYKLSFDAKTFKVRSEEGSEKFSGLATAKLPKLYIVSADGELLYVGVTKQSMRSRLRYGFSAIGKSGYHGYAWRHKFKEATLDIWCQEDAHENAMLDIETVEAEVVFLVRSAGQWPLCQTEIHFHPSNQMHRAAAAAIWRRATQRVTE